MNDASMLQFQPWNSDDNNFISPAFPAIHKKTDYLIPHMIAPVSNVFRRCNACLAVFASNAWARFHIATKAFIDLDHPRIYS
jgi:hypothetical protein